MRNTKKNSKMLLGFSLSIFMILSMLPIKAAENDNALVLTKNKVVEMAIKNSTDLKKIDLGYNKLQRGFVKAKDVSRKIDDTLDALERYDYLYDEQQELLNSPLYEQQNNYDKAVNKLEDLQEELKVLEDDLKAAVDEDKAAIQVKIDEKKKNISKQEANVEELELSSEEKKKLDSMRLNAREEMELKAYKAMFTSMYGPTPPHFSDEQEFELFIKNRDFPWYSLQGEIQKLNLTKTSAEKGITIGLTKLWDGILQFDNKIKIQQELYDVQKKQFDQLIMKVEKGQASELEKIITENELKKLELSIEKDSKDKENLEIQLKKMIGINMDQQIKLEREESEINQILELNVYLEKALDNRAEIKKAEIDLDVKDREFDITNDYLDEDYTEWKEKQEAFYETKLLLNNSKKEVEKDIKSLYIDVNNMKEQLDLAGKQLDKANKDFNVANINYEYGFISLDKLWLAQFNKTNIQIQYDIAEINYNQAVYNLEKASEI